MEAAAGYLIHTLKGKREEGSGVSRIASSPCLAIDTLGNLEAQHFPLPQFTCLLNLDFDLSGRNALMKSVR